MVACPICESLLLFVIFMDSEQREVVRKERFDSRKVRF